jgi:alanine racemase
MITVDVTDLPDVHVGDEVVLWGKGLPVAEVARHAGTIGYELTTRMPARTPRIVISG